MRLVVKKWLHLAHRRSARRLDLDDVCAQIAKNLAAQKAPLGRQIQYAARTQHDAIYAPCLLNFTRPLFGYSYGHAHAGLSHARLSHARLSHARLSNDKLPRVNHRGPPFLATAKRGRAAAKCDMVRHAGLAAVCHLNDHTPAGYRCHIVIVSSGRSRRGIAVMAASAASYFSRESVVESVAQMGPTAETAPGLQGASGNKIPIKSPRFYAFLAAQFLGAANDNAFKITLVLFVLSVISGEARQLRYSSLTTALYPVPFLLFSPLAGYFADRFTKHRVLFWTKCPEIIAMTLATIGFYLASIPFLLFVLFFTATHSSFFSPAKYGILPEVFVDKDLPVANGVLELTTDLAILIGSIAGVYAYSLFRPNLAHAGLVFLA